MSGNGWHEIFIQDPITKETQKLGVAEELTAKCMEQEYCVVTDSGLCYCMYREWVERNFYDYKDDFIFEHDEENIKPDRIYRIVGHAPHLDHKKTELYLIQDMDTEQVFIIEEEGIEKCNDIFVSTKNVDTITIDCDIQRNIYEDVLRGGERIMNNKLVDLYYNRKREEIKDKYVELLKKEYEELPVVSEYNELVETFKASLAEMADRYNTEETKVLVRTGYTNTYMYELNDDLRNELKGAHVEEYEKEMKQLELLVEEVRAQLSLSDDKDYQIDILTRYEIVNKKGKLNA